jgi:hypothetical protein
LGLNSEEDSSSSKDDGIDEVNEAFLLVLFDEPLSSVHSVRRISRKICVPKSYINCISSVCRLSAFQSQISDIFIEFLADSPIVRRQVELSRVELSWVELSRVESSYRFNFAISCCSSGINNRMRIHINPWRVMNHGSTCRQITRWSGCQMEMKSPIKRSIWFRARNWC